MQTRLKIFQAIVIMALVLSGCNFPAFPNVNFQPPAPQGKLQAWVDAPLDGSRLPLNVPYPVVCHGADPAGVSAVEFSINSASNKVLPAAEKNLLLMTARFDWRPTVPGRTVLECRAQNAAGAWSELARAVVMVEDSTPTLTLNPSLTPTATRTPTTTLSVTPSRTASSTPTASRTATITRTPSRTPTRTSTASVTSTPTPVAGFTFIEISTRQFYYTLPIKACLLTKSVTMRIRVDWPIKINTTKFFYNWRSLAPRATALPWQEKMMSPVAGKTNEFQVTINADTEVALPKVKDSGTFSYRFLATDVNGVALPSPVYADIVLSSCP